MTSCTHYTEKLNTLNSQKNLDFQNTIQSAAKYVSGAKDSLSLETNKTSKIVLSEKLLTNAESIIGVPKIGERIDVGGLLSTNKSVNSKAEKEYNRIVEKDIQMMQEFANLNEKIQQVENNLLKLGAIKEAEQNKSIISRIWGWGLATFGIGGVIALCIFCPFLIPIFTQIIAWIIARIPSIAGFFGVVGKNVATGIVKGVGNVRATLQSVDESKAYTASEVLELLDKNLKDATTPQEKVVIEHLREQVNV